MDLTKIIIVVAGFFVFIKGASYLGILKLLLSLRFKRAEVEAKEFSELPDHIAALLPRYDTHLQNLGFSIFSLNLLNPVIVSSFNQVWSVVYLNPDNNIYASLSVSPTPEKHEAIKTDFSSLFSDGSWLTTRNELDIEIIGEMPNAILNDPCAPTIEELYQGHIEKLESLNREPIRLDIQNYLAQDIKNGNEYLDSLIKGNYLKQEDKDTWRLKFFPAMKHLCKILKGIKKIRALQSAQSQAIKTQQAEPIEIPIEAEVDAYLKLEETFKGGDSSFGWKLMVFVISFIVGIVILGVGISFLNAFLILGVLLVHEFGHYLAMLIFGYKDRQIFFLPFGAATAGKKTDASSLQKVIVSLAGPALGLITGTVCVVAWTRTEIEAFWSFGIFSLVLNYINLLPITPLDGGRLFEITLFSRIPFLKTIFAILSTLVIVAAGIFLRDWILIMFGLLMLTGLKSKILINSAHSKIKKKIKSHDLDMGKESIVLEIFAFLKHKSFASLSFVKKFSLTKRLLAELMQKPAKLAEVIISLVLYFALWIIPIVIVYSLYNPGTVE